MNILKNVGSKIMMIHILKRERFINRLLKNAPHCAPLVLILGVYTYSSECNTKRYYYQPSKMIFWVNKESRIQESTAGNSVYYLSLYKFLLYIYSKCWIHVEIQKKVIWGEEREKAEFLVFISQVFILKLQTLSIAFIINILLFVYCHHNIIIKLHWTIMIINY